MRLMNGKLTRGVAATLAIGALGGGLVACGGSDSDEDKVTDAVTTALESNDEAICTESFTQDFVEEVSGEKGEAAVKNCEDSFKEDNSETTDIEVTNVKVDGDTATADASFTAGEGDDASEEKASFELAKEDGDWKIDGLGD